MIVIMVVVCVLRSYVKEVAGFDSLSVWSTGADLLGVNPDFEAVPTYRLVQHQAALSVVSLAMAFPKILNGFDGTFLSASIRIETVIRIN